MKRFVALALSSLVVLAGCAVEGEVETLDPADPLAPYLNQDVDWSDCGAGASCAIVVAPLDWDNPGVGG
ncbi:MAG: alpha/beta hydrolase, partial [Pontimonas sp.]|nr:alpha/beta hydrolase [Pontimonas sp.]